MSAKPITKDNLDICLRELAKEFKKRDKRAKAEIILIGGASILINYGFRDTTYDMDAIISASSAMKDAISAVGNKFELPVGWLNTDFVRTTSYSDKLIEHSKYYKTFSGYLTVRTVRGEYLIAMKLMAGRRYKNDLSDIVGILLKEKNVGTEITIDLVRDAVTELYGDYSKLPKTSQVFIEEVYKKEDLEAFYKECQDIEAENKDILTTINKNYPKLIKMKNISEVLEAARRKKDNK